MLKIIIAIIILVIVLIFCFVILKKKNFSGGDSTKLKENLNVLKKLLGSSELGQYISKNTNPKVWSDYTVQVTQTTAKISTEITKITANPIGLLTNVLASPECVKFLIRSAPKALIAKIKNAKHIIKYVKGKISKKENSESLTDLSKDLIKPYIKVYIELIVMIYKKDLYQPFINPLLQLIYKFPLLTANLKKAIQQLYSIYECNTIKAILLKTVDTILNSEDKMKSIYELFYNLVSTVLSNMENVLSVFIDEIKRLIKNGGKVIEDKAANMISDKINKSLNNISILNNSVASKLINSEISKLGTVLIGGSYCDSCDSLFFNIISDQISLQ